MFSETKVQLPSRQSTARGPTSCHWRGSPEGDLLDGQAELLHARSEELVAVAIQLGLDDSGF